jgi:predicted PurR-regulated permease PerM
MLGLDPRAARAAWTVLLLALLAAAAYAIRETLVVFMAALLFAYMLVPLVGLVERFTPRQVSPKIALALVYLFLVGVITVLAITLGSRLIEEANNLAAQLPNLITNRSWIYRIPLPQWMEPVRERIVDTLQSEFETGGKGVLPYIGKVGGRLVSGARYLFYVVLVPILAFFFLKDGREISEAVVSSFIDESERPVVENILEDINVLLGEYIRALVLLSISSFTANSLFLGISGAPYAVLLAGVAGLGEFIPVIGPVGAGFIVLLVTGLSGFSHLLLYVLFWIVLRMFQDYVLSPYLMQRNVKLNPLLVLFGVLAGEQIAGVIGIFFSVPVIATLRVIYIRLRRARQVELIPPRSRS